MCRGLAEAYAQDGYISQWPGGGAHRRGRCGLLLQVHNLVMRFESITFEMHASVRRDRNGGSDSFFPTTAVGWPTILLKPSVR